MYTSALLLQTLRSPSTVGDVFRKLQHPVISGLSLSCALLLLLTTSCPLLLKAFLYFCPLLASTGICLTAFYLFFQSQIHEQEEEVLLIRVGKVAHVVGIRVRGEAKFGACRDHAKVDCFLMESASTQEEGRRGRLESVSEGFHPRVAGVAERAKADGASLGWSTDKLAEGLWNCYFGSYSRWNCDEEADSQELVG
uniref:Lysine-specific demethylase 2A n=1 Tax=Anthurium amnicola TaxID=1678845 RepID=A0A1D1Y584_9ARAE